MSCQLVIKSTERKAPALQIDRSGDHLWGDVISIRGGDSDLSPLTPDPFVGIKLPCDKADVEYLLEPLDGVYRKRYGLLLENLPAQKFTELCAVGVTTLTLPVLESIIDNRSA